ncbi:hypothetical protein AGOR_G00032970 [Albula goreensis]|uniref:G-protein coupled receptors family 1 profile domain-containing protein n=1 Tax=Albula goreensis TaxID=1534307 RepID=A0A8T3E334_9TELE|nr:hypothetical protein AGOR_G00032970 [Albula goreensis]
MAQNLEDFTVSNLNVSAGNQTEEDYPDDLVFLCESETPGQATMVVAISFIVIFCLSMGGNGLVLCALALYEDLRRVTNLLVLNLAVSDLMFAATLPFWATAHLSHWVFGPALCRMVTAAYFVGLYGGLVFLTALTWDRYLTVVRGWPSGPGSRLTRTRWGCAVIWIISISSAAWETVATETRETEPGQFQCKATRVGTTADQAAFYLQVSLLFLLPLATIVFCYAGILHTAVSRASTHKCRTVSMVLCIMGAFFICWTPYNLLLLLDELAPSDGSQENCELRDTLHAAFEPCRVLAFAHCCLNPILYACTHKFRVHLSHLLCRCPWQQGAGTRRGREGLNEALSMQECVSPKMIERGVDLKCLT